MEEDDRTGAAITVFVATSPLLRGKGGRYIVDFALKRMVVTGASSGLGVETARALAGIGAEVTVAVSDTGAGSGAAADITATTGNQHVFAAHPDLLDRRSIKSLAATWRGPLHILVNNAVIMACPESRTAERR